MLKASPPNFDFKFIIPPRLSPYFTYFKTKIHEAAKFEGTALRSITGRPGILLNTHLATGRIAAQNTGS
jgi:hypothetical protein